MEKKEFYIHVIRSDTGRVIDKVQSLGVPRISEDIRLGEKVNECYTVTHVVWVYDEPECPLQRVNVGVVLVE